MKKILRLNLLNKRNKIKYLNKKITENTNSHEKKQYLFNLAGQEAVKQAQKNNLAITFVRNGKIIKEFPDGSTTILGDIAENINIKQKKYII